MYSLEKQRSKHINTLCKETHLHYTYTYMYVPTNIRVMTHLSEHSMNCTSIFIPLSESLQKKITFLILSAENYMLCGKII